MKKGFKALLLAITVILLSLTLFACGGFIENKNKFTVTFIVDGEEYATVQTDGVSMIDMPDIPEKEGYEFWGWYLDENEWNNAFKAASPIVENITKDIKVYAHFEKGTTGVRFVNFERDLNGALGDAYYYTLDKDTDLSNVSVDLTNNIIIHEDYDVKLRVLNNDTSIAILMSEVTLSNGYNRFTLEVIDKNGKKTSYDIVILLRTEHTVEFLNYDNSVYRKVTVKTGDNVDKPDDPIYSGLIFDGWYFGGGKFDFSTPITTDMTIRSEWKRVFSSYDWDTTELLFQMNMNSNGNELSSGVKRYYAGEDSKGEEIDELISERNDKAYANAKVTVKYSYLEDNDYNYSWGKNADRIFMQAIAGGSYTPDMFCNFAYDMTCAAIKGAFANLYSTRYDSNQNGKGENYFRFTQPDYNPTIIDFFDSEAGEGYFKAYMDSLSLSSGKSYCLASDYCTDFIRSFLVIPVNVRLLEQVNVDGDKVVDAALDGYDIIDFYQMVWANEWTYDMIASISSSIWQNTNTSNDMVNGMGTTTIGDRIGFAAGVGSGLTASALLYTTDVEIIDRATLSYPAENQTLNDVAAALNKLFSQNKSNGVCVVTTAQANAFGVNSKHSELLAIRNEFATGRILFGGIVTVGSLEEAKYQSMNGGFGIVPVPTYKSGIEYKTLVHNLARIVGISVVTTEFEMCTAFLNEVSTNSSRVLENYYTKNLAYAVGGGMAGTYNVHMITYIRNHVNDCFDKTYEDIVSFYKSTDNTVTWHNLLMSANYQMSDFSTVYGAMAAQKTPILKELRTQWSKLAN